MVLEIGRLIDSRGTSTRSEENWLTFQTPMANVFTPLTSAGMPATEMSRSVP